MGQTTIWARVNRERQLHHSVFSLSCVALLVLSPLSGANRLFDHYSTDADRRCHLPDCITGDLDSIRADVLAFYTTDAAAAARTLVRRDPDQDSTDLEKCIAWIRRAEAQAKATAAMQRQQQEQGASKTISASTADAASTSSAPLLAPVPTPAVSAAAMSASSSPAAPAPTPSPSPAGLEEWHSAAGSAVAHAFFAACPPLRSLPLLLYPAFGGRFDQQVAMLHAMHKAARWCDDVLMIAEGNSARILMPTAQDTAEGDATIAAEPSAAAASSSSSPLVRSMHRLPIHPCLELGHHCGLYPLGAAASSVSTTGLQWNLSSQRMEWGALISTNNIVREAEVTVRTDQALVWTTEMQHERVLKPMDAAKTGGE